MFMKLEQNALRLESTHISLQVLPAYEPIDYLKSFKNNYEAIITLEAETEHSDTVLGVRVFKLTKYRYSTNQLLLLLRRSAQP